MVRNSRHPGGLCWIERFFHDSPVWAQELHPASTAFLQQLRGKTPIARIAERAQRKARNVFPRPPLERSDTARCSE